MNIHTYIHTYIHANTYIQTRGLIIRIIFHISVLILRFSIVLYLYNIILNKIHKQNKFYIFKLILSFYNISLLIFIIIDFVIFLYHYICENFNALIILTLRFAI